MKKRGEVHMKWLRIDSMHLLTLLIHDLILTVEDFHPVGKARQ